MPSTNRDALGFQERFHLAGALDVDVFEYRSPATVSRFREWKPAVFCVASQAKVARGVLHQHPSQVAESGAEDGIRTLAGRRTKAANEALTARGACASARSPAQTDCLADGAGALRAEERGADEPSEATPVSRP